MDPERWQEIERIYHLACERTAGSRAIFLDEACGGDEKLRQEVESLLSHADGAQEYIEAGIGEAAKQIRGRTEVTDLAGRTLSHYRLLEILGSGGMGVVYRAEDLRLRREVALKLLNEDLMGDHLAVERLQREARAAASVNHPNICTVYEAGEDDGHPFLTMELLEGSTLKARIGGQRLALDELLELAGQILSGLAAAHARGIIHRDIKPANLFVTTAGQAKILDFGLARRERGGVDGLAETLTRPNEALGTAAYMSPEQARGESLDGRTDLFSFGAVLYEMATGQRAFEGTTMATIFDAILNRRVTWPSALNRVLPTKLQETIFKALEKDPARRYQSAEAMLADLKSDACRVRPRTTRRVLPVAALVLVFCAVGIGFWSRWRPAPHLGGANTIVLADFTNTTGDPVFDGALRRALSSQLEQSPFLSLLSDARIAGVLVLMAQPGDARITQKLAREVCQRTAGSATIEGSIESSASQYTLGLRAVNCATGDVLAEAHVPAKGREQVLAALGEAAAAMRRQLGESLASVQKYDAPPKDVTTGSLEALQAYNLGYRAHIVRHDEAAAIPFLQHAVSLDPNFAMAFSSLGSCYSNHGEVAQATGNLTRAWELRERVSEHEKLYISLLYETNVTGNLEAARKDAEQYMQAYPRDDMAGNQLANILVFMGDYGNALPAAQAAVRLDPQSGLVYTTAAMTYLDLNRLDEARAMATRARDLGAAKGNRYLYQIDFLQHDSAAMARDATGYRSKPEHDAEMTGLESDVAADAGKFELARELTRRAAATARKVGDAQTAAGLLSFAALRDALVGNRKEALQLAQAALALSDNIDDEVPSAMALALAGNSTEAGRLAADLARRFPQDTLVQTEYVPMIQAGISLTTPGGSVRAIEILRVASRYERAQIHSIYLRGQAFLAAREGVAAIAEFQKILDNPGAVTNFDDGQVNIVGTLAHLGMGRAYALTGDNAKARAAYQDFLARWKDADPGIPLLKQAKAEYAGLVK